MAAAPVSVVTPSAIEGRELGSDLAHVLVAAAGESQDVEAVAAAGLVEEPGDRVRRLKRGDDPLEPGELTEGAQGLGVGGGDVGRAPGIAEMRVLWPDTWVIETRRDGVRLEDLALIVLEDGRERPVEHPLASSDQGGTVVSCLESLPPGLDPDQLDRVVEKGVEAADGVRSAADAGDHSSRQRALGLERLGAGLVADHPLQVSDQGRIRRRSDDGTDYVVGGLDRCDPVSDCRAHGLLKRPRPRVHRDHLGAEQLHPLDVRGLPADVLGAHVDGALEAEERAGRCRRYAMLPGAGLGDHAALAHPARQQRLADGVVDLVRPGVGEVLALEVDTAANSLREALGEIERRRTADEVAEEDGKLGPEALVLPRLGRRGAELIERRDQGLGDESATVVTETLLHRLAHPEAALDGISMPAASRNASTLAWSFRPGSASTPLTTSTAKGLTSSTARETFSAVRPPARIIGTFERRFATRSQSKLWPVPPWMPCQYASKRWKPVRNVSAAWTSAALVTRIALI